MRTDDEIRVFSPAWRSPRALPSQAAICRGGCVASYATRLREHLAEYKRTRLGVRQDGVWLKNGQSYPHILPRKLRRLNILEAIRREFWLHRRDRQIELHRDFHHLTSSQAMAFNLFFPFFGLGNGHSQALLDGLGLQSGSIAEWGFERVLDPAEGTNFDFHLAYADGRQVFFEAKLCESGFGKAKRNARHSKKLDDLYRARLLGNVGDANLAEQVFLQNYQLLRNVSYLHADANHQLVLICPKANDRLQKGLRFLEDALTSELRGSVRVVYLETLMGRLRNHPGLEGRLAAHIDLMGEKYLI
jgi:hypothetical protein